MSQTIDRPAAAPPLRIAAEPIVVRHRPMSVGSAWDRVLSWSRRHPDLCALGIVLSIGLLMRLALLYRIPPLFMPGDSQSFLTPAYDLARGLGFDPILKRPLGYPLLVAGAISLLGEDLRGLVLIQALLGLVTITATYWIGRMVSGRAAGVLASLTVALGGQLLIYEHYILAESVFAMFLALAMLGLIVAGRSGRTGNRWAAAGGVALAFASLFRPIAEVAVPLLPVYFLLAVRPPRRALVLTGLAVLGFLATMGPAFLADLALRGGVSSGALGEHLLWRITRSDSGYIRREDVPPEQPGSPEAQARRYVLRKAADRTLPQEIFENLVREQGLSSAEADSVMRGVALEAIGRQPVRYLTTTVQMTVQLFFGDDQQLGEISKREGEARYINPQSRQKTWFEERIMHLGEPPSPAVENEFDNASLLTNIYQPGRFAWIIGAGFVLGGLATVVSRHHRPGLLLLLTIPPMLLANAALAGPEARFRYPMDPLIAVLAAVGLVWVCQMAWRQFRPSPA